MIYLRADWSNWIKILHQITANPNLLQQVALTRQWFITEIKSILRLLNYLDKSSFKVPREPNYKFGSLHIIIWKGKISTRQRVIYALAIKSYEYCCLA